MQRGAPEAAPAQAQAILTGVTPKMRGAWVRGTAAATLTADELRAMWPQRSRAARRRSGSCCTAGCRIRTTGWRSGHQKPVRLRAYDRGGDIGERERAIHSLVPPVCHSRTFFISTPGSISTPRAAAVRLPRMDRRTASRSGALAGFAEGVAAGYVSDGTRLPEQWLAVSRIADMFAMLEMMNRPSVADVVVESVYACIADLMRTMPGAQRAWTPVYMLSTVPRLNTTQ